MKKILVVEDDEMLACGLCYHLELDGYETASVQNAATAEKKINTEKFDLIILDVNLPDTDGFTLCHKIRAEQSVPVIFLTARDLDTDVMRGFDMGADDYITKPFNVHIFKRKVAALLKRTGQVQKTDVYECDGLKIDFDRLTAMTGDEPVVLTPTEYKILKIFTDSPGMLLTRNVLLDKMYDKDAVFADEHALTVNINRIRSKIETGERKYIRTVYGMGYIWEDQNIE